MASHTSKMGEVRAVMLRSLGACLPAALAQQVDAAMAAAAEGSHDYAQLGLQVLKVLEYDHSIMPGDTIAAALQRSDVAVAQVIATAQESKGAPQQRSPRDVLGRAFAETLLRVLPGATPARVLELARQVETACYNEAVNIAKQSEDPPRRAWDCLAFVDIYSTRCGSILGLLGPESEASARYGLRLAADLYDGRVTPAALGALGERELCPAAFDAETAEIASRSAQTIELKESTLFCCPHCGQRRCVYREVQRRALDEPADCVCLCLNPECRRRFTGHA